MVSRLPWNPIRPERTPGPLLGWIALCLALLAPVSRARDRGMAPFTYHKLAKLIPKVRSLSELLDRLPPEMRSNFTLVYQSRSPHGDFGDPAQTAIDSKYPRVIVFSPNGKLLVAFTGDPGRPGYDTLEVIHFREDTERFELSQFILPRAVQARPALAAEARRNGEVNPAQCLRCHGSDPRPIYDSYPIWPGFYGSVRDSFSDDSSEAKRYRGFLAKQRRSPSSVYGKLRWPEGTSVPPYLDPKAYDPSHLRAEPSALSLLPNTRLGMALTEWNRKRLQRKLRSSPLYERYKYALLSFLLGCEGTEVPIGALQKARLALIAENQAKLARLHLGSDLPATATPDMFEIGFAANAAKITHLAEVLQLDRGDWAMSMEEGSLAFFDGILSGDYQDRNFYLIEDFIQEMMRDLTLEDPELAPYFQTYSAFPEKGRGFGTRLAIGPALASCEKLIAKIPAEGKPPRWQPDEPRIAAATLPGLDSILDRLHLHESPFAACVRCHEGERAIALGRQIPFSTPQELRERLHARSKSSRKNLFEEILARIQPYAPGHMPPGVTSLSEEERAALESYLTLVLR